MHPAPSVIIFTTLSGLGFGLLVFLGLGMPAVTGLTAFVFFAIAYVLAVGGLAASTFHLGHPKRAWKAFSQWKTSWLSREGICAVASLIVMAIYGAGLVFLLTPWAVLGWLGAALSLATVFTTSMIYTQMKTVPRWNMPWTPAYFLSLSLAGGALLAGQSFLSVFLLLLAGAITLATWVIGDSQFARSGTDMETATGLGSIGSVRAFEPPHTGTNYLTREFIHVVGRKHSQKLRIIAGVLAFVIPITLMFLLVNHVTAAIAILSHIAGVAVARWLFFAEAEHVVGLYYGKR
ncbi:dibenzothiophene desulfurase [Jannaschia sp. EhC01]|nr:dibenzothiophene desulfurase [Jannaschia sp. EhC01]